MLMEWIWFWNQNGFQNRIYESIQMLNMTVSPYLWVCEVADVIPYWCHKPDARIGEISVAMSKWNGLEWPVRYHPCKMSSLFAWFSATSKPIQYSAGGGRNLESPEERNFTFSPPRHQHSHNIEPRLATLAHSHPGRKSVIMLVKLPRNLDAEPSCVLTWM